MALDTYTNLQTAITNWLGGRTDLTTYYPDWITLFEAAAARKLRVRPMETVATLSVLATESADIIGMADNGVGHNIMRLEIADTSPYNTGDLVTISGILGLTGANGSWIITVINSTRIDLQNSFYDNFNPWVAGGGTIERQSGTYKLPSNYLYTRRVTWLGSPRIELQYLEPSAFQAFYPDLGATNTDNSRTPQSYTIEGGYLKVSSFSTDSNLELVYYAKNDAVSGALNWLFTTYPDVYLFGSLAEAGGFVRDDVALAGWIQRRDMIFDEIKMVDFRERPSSMAVKVMGYTP